MIWLGRGYVSVGQSLYETADTSDVDVFKLAAMLGVHGSDLYISKVLTCRF